MPKSFLSTLDGSREELQRLLDDARVLKPSLLHNDLASKSVALVFFNSSLCTRTTFELGVQQIGDTAIVLNPASGAPGTP